MSYIPYVVFPVWRLPQASHQTRDTQTILEDFENTFEFLNRLQNRGVPPGHLTPLAPGIQPPIHSKWLRRNSQLLSANNAHSCIANTCNHAVTCICGLFPPRPRETRLEIRGGRCINGKVKMHAKTMQKERISVHSMHTSLYIVAWVCIIWHAFSHLLISRAQRHLGAVLASIFSPASHCAWLSWGCDTEPGLEY